MGNWKGRGCWGNKRPAEAGKAPGAGFSVVSADSAWHGAFTCLGQCLSSPFLISLPLNACQTQSICSKHCCRAGHQKLVEGGRWQERDEVGKGRKTILKTQPGEREPASSASQAPSVLQEPSPVGVCAWCHHPSGYAGSHGDHFYASVGPRFSGISPNTSATPSHMTLLQIPGVRLLFSTLNLCY